MVASGRNQKPEKYYDEDAGWLLREIADEIEMRESFKYISEDDTDQLFVYEDGISVVPN